MDKINFEDLPSTNTPINAENLNKVQENVENAIKDAVDDIKRKSIITAGINSNFTATTTGINTIPIDKIINNKGTVFTVENEKIIINDDISYVKISANICVNCGATSNGALNLVIYKNGTEVAVSMSTITTTVVTNQARQISPILFSVSKGDYFELKAYMRANEFVMNQPSRTNITIEEV